MKERILETLSEKNWMWMEELRSHFMLCDLQTHYVFINPEFSSAIANLSEQGFIRIINRLEIKGYYKKTGKIVELVNSASFAKKC
ncbi:hypothetical protein [Dulcicalothrix desertica]|uniref:hypothetical protein n=1 Tax=Dulcicalothrix desertica TaxID=32056 RepID=UPI000F8C9BBD|nr:hypothetical protein [Dulcicalothrix desertica]TWH42915.1 hypothetical protein CAL7102_06598 [Dulcicalothrix desertica PCC 7102]